MWPVSPEAPPDRPPEPPDRPNPLEAVRSAAAEVARRAEVVRLVPERLAPYARELLDERVLDPAASAGRPEAGGRRTPRSSPAG